MIKPCFYIYLNKEVIEIFDAGYVPNFDEKMGINSIDFYFSDKQIQGDWSKIKESSVISMESNDFFVENAVVEKVQKMDSFSDDGVDIDDVDLYFLNIKLQNPFITGSDLDYHKIRLKRKRTIDKIIKNKYD
jgi:hypothetical protein